MELKEIKNQPVYFKEVKATLKTIHQYVGTFPAQIAMELQEQNLEPTDDQIWRYIGSDGNPETEFSLQVGYPVKGVNTEFPAFKCVSHTYKGPWSDFGKVYEQLIGEIMVKGYKLSGETREIYRQVDFEKHDNNITEIQIGIL